MMIKTLFLLSFLFFIYSFIGWILEVVQSAFHQKRLVNRGFINSPLCISYGIGAIVITINTHQMTGLWIFAAAMIDATVIEWFGGHFIEHFYHERWWDYSKNKWNLDGYICLSHSVFWGLLGYIGVKFVNPLLFKFYHLIPPFIRHLIIFILLAVLIIDILATTIVVFGKNIDKRRWESADAYLTKISVKLSSLITSYVDRRVERAYPQRKLKLPTIPKTGVFAQGCGFYKVFLLFSIGSLLGDIIETIFCRLKMGVWMSRSSLVWGPFSIVWGLAIAIATALLYKDREKPDRHIFIVGTFLGCVIGFAVGVVQTIPVDKNDGKSLMRCPPRKAAESLFARGGMACTLLYGALITGIGLAAFLVLPCGIMAGRGELSWNLSDWVEGLRELLSREKILARSQTYAFTVLGMCQLYHAVGMRDMQKSVFAMRPWDNPLMVLACVIGFALQFAVTEVPFLIGAFGTSHLSG